MITIISATNRPNSNTKIVAEKYSQLVDSKSIESGLLSFEDLPHNFLFTDLYDKRTEEFQKILDKYIIPVNKIVIVAPEYNGSYPGILKSFFDAIHPDINRGKKIGLVGVATGRSGNVRGMEHLTGVLHYLGMHVLPNKLPISQFLQFLDSNNHIKDQMLIKAIERHVDEMIKW